MQSDDLESKKPQKNTIPPWNFDGPYNVSRADLCDYSGQIWLTTDALPELSGEEFERVRARVALALYKLGFVENDYAQGEKFFVWDDKYFDRTIRIEYYESGQLSNELPSAVVALQECLQEELLWRVFMTSHAKAHAIWVYPNDIRTALDETGIPLDERIKRIASEVEEWEDQHPDGAPE